MTSSLPTPPKSPTAEGARLDLGNFFQPPSSSRTAPDSSKPDFESLLSQRQPKNPTEEAREEREAAKARKKPIDIAVSAPLTQETATPRPETPEPSAASPQNPSAPESLSTAESRPESQPAPKEPSNGDPQETSPEQPEAESAPQELEADPANLPPGTVENSESQESEPAKETAPTSELVEENPLAPEKTREARQDKEAEKADANGMEPAPLDPEMISLATIDGIESGSAALREPSITSSHRLTAFAATDRNGLAPVGGAGGSSESGLGHLATGTGQPLEARPASGTTPTAQAAALFKSLAPELEKFQQTSRSQMQLDLPVGENESVRVRLSIRGGELRSTFITESPELREALQKAWPEFAQTSRDRGVRLGDPVFQQSFQGNDTAFGQNNRRNSGSADSESSLPAGIPASRKPAARTSSNPPSTALWA